MIKLKIGTNYFLYFRKNYPEDFKLNVIFMMSSFKEKNKIVTNLVFDEDLTHYKEIVKYLKDNKISEIYLIGQSKTKKSYFELKSHAQAMIEVLNKELPYLTIKVIINTSHTINQKAEAANRLYELLKTEPNNVLNHLQQLQPYKEMTTRLKRIPTELKVINDELDKISKEEDIYKRTNTLESIQYMNLINTAQIIGDRLHLQIKPMPIYCSEDLGLVYSIQDFRSNEFLFKTAYYLYQPGNHFMSMGSNISLSRDFNPKFISTLDNRFDKMLEYNNWSGGGYPHFGPNHLCAGEFLEAISSAKRKGMEYYLLSLKQYLMTANMRDSAGCRVWWYPIYNEKGEMVYCAGIDTLIEKAIKYNNPEYYEELSKMSYEEKATELRNFNYENLNLRCYCPISLNYSSNNSGKDSFLQLKQTDEYKKLCENIMKGELVCQ